MSTSRPEDVLTRADRCLAESRLVAERARSLLAQLQSDTDAQLAPAAASYERSWPRAVTLPAPVRASSPTL